MKKTHKFILGYLTLKFAAFSNRKDKHDAFSWAECRVQLPLIHRQGRPHALSKWDYKLPLIFYRLCYIYTTKQNKIHTFALARETFSWLLLLIRKYLASLRTYFSLLVWSMRWRRSQKTQKDRKHAEESLLTHFCSWELLTFSHSPNRRRQLFVLLFRPCKQQTLQVLKLWYNSKNGYRKYTYFKTVEHFICMCDLSYIISTVVELNELIFSVSWTFRISTSTIA